MPRGFSIAITEHGIGLTAKHMEDRGRRAGNLIPVWELAEEMILKSNERRFRSEGYGTWADEAPDSIRRHGVHNMMELTGKLRAALTRRGASGQVNIKLPTTFVFGLAKDGPVGYGLFHQTGTKKMPRREIFRVTRTTRTKVDEAIALYITSGKIR